MPPIDLPRVATVELGPALRAESVTQARVTVFGWSAHKADLGAIRQDVGPHYGVAVGGFRNVR